MQNEYLQHYVDGIHLRLSMDALWHHLIMPPSPENAKTMTEWGPFFLSGANAPFVPTFLRTVDRALHHSGNVWRQLVGDLSSARFAFRDLTPDSVIHTFDKTSKYEIEAFLGAVVTVTEEHLIGSNAKDRLAQSHGLSEDLRSRIRSEALSFKALGTARKWRNVRNSAYHLKPEMRDWGFTARIRLDGDKC